MTMQIHIGLEVVGAVDGWCWTVDSPESVKGITPCPDSKRYWRWSGFCLLSPLYSQKAWHYRQGCQIPKLKEDI
jgi:hypothetical protein